MHIRRTLSSLVVVVTFAGCAAVIGTETRFTPWSGQQVSQGQGGAVEAIDGIEIWSHGSPARRHRILGIVEQSRSDDAFDNLLFGRFNRSEIVNLVKQAGGHGVVTVQAKMVGTAQAVQRNSVMAVFRYEAE